MKKVLSLVLVLTMLLSTLTVVAFANDGGTTTPTGTVIYEQNFDNVADFAALGYTAENFTDGTTVAKVEGGKLVIDNKGASKDAFVVIYDQLPTDLKDWTLEADMTLVESTNTSRYGGLLGYYTDATNYTSFQVRFTGVYNFETRANATYTPLGTQEKANVSEFDPPFAVGAGASYSLKIHFHGITVRGGYVPTADAYINGVKVATGSNDLGALTAKLGLLIKQQAVVSFDNIKVTEYERLSGNEVAPVNLPTITTLTATETGYDAVMYDETTNPEAKPYGMWKVGANTPLYLSDIDYFDGLCTSSAPTKDGFYKNPGQGITIGGVKYDKGMGVHPNNANMFGVAELYEKNPNDAQFQDGGWLSWWKPETAPEDYINYYGYLVYDISAYTDPNGEYKYDSFYSAVGLTNTTSRGVQCAVYGDKGEGFELLSCSDKIKYSNVGEFNIDITGVKMLLLVYSAVDAHNSSALGWANLAIFKADPNAVKPDYSVPVGGGDQGGEDDGQGQVTEPVTEPVTDAPVTDAPVTEAPTTEAPAEEKKGCGSVAGLAVVALVSTLGAGAVMATKKRK